MSFETGAEFEAIFDNNQKNHLIIGLGGTGGRILRSFKKTQFIDRKNEINNIGFLYVDTDDSFMKGGESWRVLGQSVDLPEDSKFLLNSPDLNVILNNIDNYPHIKNWFNKNEKIIEFSQNTVGLKTAGAQRRRLGRISFALQANEFNQKVGVLVGNLRNETTQDLIDFHICCGISGGTGSGILIDVIAQIRKFYNTRTANIFLYLHLAEESHTNWDAGFYYANSYATLKELNGMSILKYHPYDVTNEKGERFNKDNVSNYFKGAYIVENVNSKGTSLDSKEGIPDLIGNFLFSKIVGNSNEIFQEQVLGRQENFENVEPEPEYDTGSTYLEFYGNNKKNYSRSLRFLSFGLKKLEVPKEEIFNYIIFNNVNSILNALLFNNWQPNIGYVNENKPSQFDDFVNENLERWKISNDYFKLDQQIIENNNNYISNKRFWETVIPHCVRAAQRETNGHWLNIMMERCNAQFDSQFRGVGVTNFYHQKIGNIGDYCNKIMSLIKNDLFSNWKEREISLTDISRICRYLRENIINRRNELIEINRKNRHKLTEIDQNINLYYRRWSNIGILAEAIFNKKVKLLGEFSQVLKNKFMVQTDIHAIQFADELMTTIVNRITEFELNIDNLTGWFINKTENVLEQVNSLVKEDEMNYLESKNLKSRIIRFFDPLEIRDFTQSLKTDRDFQTEIYDLFYGDLVNYENINNVDLFSQLISKDSSYVFNSIIEKVQKKFNDRLQTNQIQNNQLNGLLEDLKIKFKNNEESLQSFFKKIIELSNIFLRFDNNQKNALVGTGIVNPIESTTILLPSSQDDNFVNKLKKVFRNIKADCIFIDREDPYKIEIISIVNKFPIRLISHISSLNKKYKSIDADKRVFIHTDDSCFELPDLLIKTSSELSNEIKLFQSSDEVFEVLLLGYIFEIIKENKDEAKFYFWTKNTTDISVRKNSLGNSYADNLNYINKTIFKDIKEEVNIDFRNSTQTVEQRKELIEMLKHFITKLRENNKLDETITSRYSSVANSIIEKINN